MARPERSRHHPAAPPSPVGLFVQFRWRRRPKRQSPSPPTVTEMDDDHPPQGDDAPMRARQNLDPVPDGAGQAAVTRVTADRQG